MVDTLQTQTDLGYQIADSQAPVSLLQYADDACLIRNSPVSCQHLINNYNGCLGSGMKAKIPKCASFGLQASSGRMIDPALFLDDQSIPFTPDAWCQVSWAAYQNPIRSVQTQDYFDPLH